MTLAVGTVKSVTVTTHTATYTLHEAPLVDCTFYYEPGVWFQPQQFMMVWTDDNEPSGVSLIGFRTDNGQSTTKTYGITQAPKWLYELLLEHFADKNWKILPPKGVQKPA